MDACMCEGMDSMALDSVVIGWTGKRGITGLHGFACLVFLGGTRGDVVRYFYIGNYDNHRYLNILYFEGGKNQGAQEVCDRYPLVKHAESTFRTE